MASKRSLLVERFKRHSPVPFGGMASNLPPLPGLVFLVFMFQRLCAAFAFFATGYPCWPASGGAAGIGVFRIESGVGIRLGR